MEQRGHVDGLHYLKMNHQKLKSAADWGEEDVLVHEDQDAVLRGEDNTRVICVVFVYLFLL